MVSRINYTGERIGLLTIIKRNGFVENGVKTKKRYAAFDCMCDCGRVVNRVRKFLIEGYRQHCGDPECKKKIRGMQKLTNKHYAKKIAYYYGEKENGTNDK